ncbi:MAG: SDR family oxidoreductase [Alphaproteobacteria bacterium]|nr:SDR family oxidoreductase [Alphaproteobacteria bacterium]
MSVSLHPLQDCVVLVTGASGGIGSAIALAFAAQGARVVVHYHQRREQAEQLAAQCQQLGGDGWALAADLTDASQTCALIERVRTEFGHIDSLIHNAYAPYRFNPDQRLRFWELDWDSVQLQIDGSVRACFELCQAALPLMRERSNASIVLIGTDLVSRPTIAYTDYATAKSALLGLARQMAADLGPLGIRVNTLAPGLVQGTRASAQTPESVREQIARITPMGRVATPQDVAGAVMLLTSSQAGFITGQLLHVDGGLVMG